MAAAGKGERQRRIPGDGGAEAERTVTDAKGVTPVIIMIIWIKWQKTCHARSLASCLATARPAPTAMARPAAARACGMPLYFSQLLNLDE